MKIGILTFPNSTSYGASLQMYALYKTAQELGNDVEIINYNNSYMKSQRHIAKMQTHGAWIRTIRIGLKSVMHLRQYMGFREFEKLMTKYPVQPISKKQRMEQISERYDATICGSDQVWNPDITNYDLSYFLDFCGPGTRRISYAPSFGVEELSGDYGEAVAKELDRFSSLSVREETGKKLIMQLTNRNAKLVLDPTLLLDSEDWKALEEPHPSADGDYILYYTVRGSESLWQYCLKLAKKCNMKILRIGANAISKNFKRSDDFEYVCDITPQEWLYLIHHARYIVTNSFHGTAFAINYRKDFFVEFSSLTNSRLTQIINMLGLEKQVVTDENASLPDTTDYAQTEELLPTMKMESLTYLKQALEEVAEKNEKE